MQRPRGRRRRRLRRAAVPLGAVALFGLNAALTARGHPLPPPGLGGGAGRLARPREVAPLLRAQRLRRPAVSRPSHRRGWSRSSPRP
ncbi:hypothetical protein ABT127_01795 [Streptomyces sp. NPDC001904]|uniref:hypothetical protein n=1 Tax=Streptomyces sp. NPDC001904 TaxID=3154531 RepID=UPI003329C541